VSRAAPLVHQHVAVKERNPALLGRHTHDIGIRGIVDWIE